MTGIDVCSHGRPDHQELIRQLLDALGLFSGARSQTPADVFAECLAEIGRLRAEPAPPLWTGPVEMILAEWDEAVVPPGTAVEVHTTHPHTPLTSTKDPNARP